MIFVLLARFVDLLAQLLILLIIVSALASWFLPPYHPVRETLDRLVDPMLNPIRRNVPPVGGFDISPIILIVLIAVINTVLRNILLIL
jgi:YggT family protein